MHNIFTYGEFRIIENRLLNGFKIRCNKYYKLKNILEWKEIQANRQKTIIVLKELENKGLLEILQRSNRRYYKFIRN